MIKNNIEIDVKVKCIEAETISSLCQTEAGPLEMNSLIFIMYISDREVN